MDITIAILIIIIFLIVISCILIFIHRSRLTNRFNYLKSKDKIIIFSHKNDIDGMGSIILLKQIYKKVEYVLCECTDVNEQFMYYFRNNLLDEYDKVFITDIHLNEKNLELVNNNSALHDKTILLDHNESVTHFNSYDFVNIIIKDKNDNLCCSTTLLYEYLLSNNIIRHTNALDDFCEATRLYDTGQWSIESNNQIPRGLSLFFDIIGTDKYIKIFSKKLRKHTFFSFNLKERRIIRLKKESNTEKVLRYISNIRIKNIKGYKAGIVSISYEYRNEVTQYLRETKIYDIDLLILIAMDNNSISIRNINPEVNVRLIAEEIGGKGHFGAAGCTINQQNMEKIVKMLF